MNKLIGIFSTVKSDEKITSYGSELIDQVLWNQPGLAWWSAPDANWSGDGILVSSSGANGYLDKYLLSVVGLMYRSVIIVSLTSGLLYIYHGMTPPVRTISKSGIYTTDAVANHHHFMLSSTNFLGSVSFLSYKRKFNDE